jgi:hypothetical protein
MKYPRSDPKDYRGDKCNADQQQDWCKHDFFLFPSVATQAIP